MQIRLELTFPTLRALTNIAIYQIAARAGLFTSTIMLSAAGCSVFFATGAGLILPTSAELISASTTTATALFSLLETQVIHHTMVAAVL
ncbi:MAG: hypothetical protein H7240_02990 [Glaciimonas sp.]|nr:hypothetical protein [Glaciimonas sp.]